MNFGLAKRIMKISSVTMEKLGTEFFYVITLNDATHRIQQRIHKQMYSIKFISELFDAAKVAFRNDLDWNTQFSQLTGSYIIIEKATNKAQSCTLSEEIIAFYCADTYYSCYTEEPATLCHHYDSNLLAFQTYTEGDDLISVPTKRKYFVDFQSANQYMIACYDEINKDTRPDYNGIVNLFKIGTDAKRHENLLMHIYGNSLTYFNDLAELNHSLQRVRVDHLHFDGIGRIEKSGGATFYSKQAASNYISAYNREWADMNSYAEELSPEDDSKILAGNAATEAAFNEKNIENMLNIRSSDDDYFYIALEGDQQNEWNID